MSETFGIAPFVDGSIRREPDLEHPTPTISALCRAGMFAPRLQVGDHVAYLTIKRRWGGLPRAHWRLTAVLRVERRFEDHRSAASWFRNQGMCLPSNCMVAGNPAKPLRESLEPTTGLGCAGDRRMHRAWDAFYRRRVAKHGAFLVCAPLFVELSYKAPVLRTEDFMGAFGRVPGTRTPGDLPREGFEQLLRVAGVRLGTC